MQSLCSKGPRSKQVAKPMQRISKDQQTDAPAHPPTQQSPAKAPKRAYRPLSGPRLYVGSLQPVQRPYGPHIRPAPSTANRHAGVYAYA